MGIFASPIKLRSGAWGARVQGAVAAGDEVMITTASGKSWQARVERVVWTDGSTAICATVSLDRPADDGHISSQRRRLPGRRLVRPGYCRECRYGDRFTTMGRDSGICDDCA